MKSRIFERMGNFHNDCCHPCTKKPFKNSRSRQLRIIKRSCYVDCQQVGSTDRNLFFFNFETMMTTVDEVKSDKTKRPKKLFSVVFWFIVLLPNSMSKLIHNQCKLTCKLLIKTM